MYHTVDSCPLTKLDDSLSRLHSADDDAVKVLVNLGRCICKKKDDQHIDYEGSEYDLNSQYINTGHKITWYGNKDHKWIT